jgi:hypothetical protein
LIIYSVSVLGVSYNTDAHYYFIDMSKDIIIVLCCLFGSWIILTIIIKYYDEGYNNKNDDYIEIYHKQIIKDIDSIFNSRFNTKTINKDSTNDTIDVKMYSVKYVRQ